MIVTNTLRDKAFMEVYRPYQPPSGTAPVYTVEDMITYNLEPKEVPTNIDYYIGSANNYIEIFTIRNITTNAVLDITVDIDNRKDIWLLNESKRTVTLGPSQSHVFEYRLNREVLSIASTREQILSTISVIVTNRREHFVLRNTSIESIERKQLVDTSIR